MRRITLTTLAAAVILASCSGDDAVTSSRSDGALPETTALPEATVVSTAATTTTTVLTTTTAPATSTSTTTSTIAVPLTTTTTSTTSTTTVAPTTETATTQAAAPSELPTFDFAQANLSVGTSVEGRPITADRYGTPGGRRVLVIGVIHGNEDAGVQIVNDLRAQTIPDGIELWLVESMNPDGQASQIRQNANGVDLNRNFPHEWGPIGELGNSQYAGTGPASEPETQVMVNFIAQLRPDIAIWYHQDANLVIPSTGRDGRLRARYAELTGLPIADCCGGGGVYTGIAATWARVELKQTSDAVPFIVELPGGELSTEQVSAHSGAVLTIAAEG